MNDSIPKRVSMTSTGGTGTPKKTYTTRNLSTALQAVALKAEQPRAPSSDATRLTVIPNKVASKPQEGASSMTQHPSSTAGQQGPAKAEPRSSPRSAPAEPPKPSNVWAARQQQALSSRASAGQAPSHESYRDRIQPGSSPPLSGGPMQSSGYAHPPHQGERWGQQARRGSFQDASTGERDRGGGGGDYDAGGYGYQQPPNRAGGAYQDRRGARPGSPEPAGGCAEWGSRWGERGPRAPDGAGVRDRQPPAPAPSEPPAYGKAPPSWEREQQDARYGGASQAPSTSGSWGSSARQGYPNLSYNTPSAEGGGDSGASGWGESSTGWGSGWGQHARPQEPAPPAPPSAPPSGHYLYDHHTDSMHPTSQPSAPPPPSAPHHPPHQHRPQPGEHAEASSRKPSGMTMGNVQILKAGQHSPEQGPVTSTASHAEAKGGEEACVPLTPSTPVRGPVREESRRPHEGPPPPRPENAEGTHKASPTAAKAKEEVSTKEAAPLPPAPPPPPPPPPPPHGHKPQHPQQRHQGRGGMLDQPWEKVAMPDNPHHHHPVQQGFKNARRVHRHEEEGHEGERPPRPAFHHHHPMEKDMSEEAVARREARQKERETRAPRIKGVLYTRTPDGKLVLVDSNKTRDGPRVHKDKGPANNNNNTSAYSGKKQGGGAEGQGKGKQAPHHSPPTKQHQQPPRADKEKDKDKDKERDRVPVVQVSIKDAVGPSKPRPHPAAAAARHGGGKQ